MTGLKLEIPSPSYDTVTQTIDGQSGAIVLDRVLKPRNLKASFVSKADNYLESLKLRDKLYSLIGGGAQLYVSESERPNRRWKVYADDWTPTRFDEKYHTFDVPLVAYSGMAESISLIKKSFTTSSFRFKNDGNVIIDPRVYSNSETEIDFSGVSSGLTIKNTTTGDEWNWDGDTVGGDTISIKGIKSLKNNVSIFGQTNKKLITFAPGWNNFEILGATDGQFTLTIQTRFYFL